MKPLATKINIDSFKKDAIILLKNIDIPFYLDTNVLIDCYFLSQNAQNELFTFFESLMMQKRLFIPCWVIKEYNDYIITDEKDLQFPLKKIKNEIEEKLVILMQKANLYIDNEIIKDTQYINKDAYLSHISEVSNSLKNILNLLTKPNNNFYNKTRTKIESLIESCAIDSKMSEIYKDVLIEGDFRFANKLPPGYKDSNKTTNKYGDLIIWKEILNHISKKQSHGTIFLTNDEKTDWVYKPSEVETIDKGYSSFRDYKIPNPYLIKEFEDITKNENLVILSIGALVTMLSACGYTCDELERYTITLKNETKRKSDTKKTLDWLNENKQMRTDFIKYSYLNPNIESESLLEDFIKGIENRPIVDFDKVDWGYLVADIFLKESL